MTFRDLSFYILPNLHVAVSPAGRSLGGIIFAKMLATGKEKDPAIDADPELLQKARTNPKGRYLNLR